MGFFDREKIHQLLLRLEPSPELVHKKSFQLTLLAVVIFLLLIIFVPLTFDNSDLKFKLEQKISESLKANLEITGKVRVAIFPVPTVSIDEVFLQNYNLKEKNYNFYAKNIKIKGGFFSFLFGNFNVKKIIIYDAVLQNYFPDIVVAKREDAFSEVLQKKSADNKLAGGEGFTGKIFNPNQIDFSNLNSQNFPTLVIKNSRLISYDLSSTKQEISQINSKISFSETKINAEGNFSNQDILNEFEVKARFDSEVGQNNSFVKITSPFAMFKITGAFTAENKGLLNSIFIGDLQGEIYDFKNFYKSFVSSEGLIYNKLNPITSSIKIRADIVNNSEEISVSNLAINSNYVNGVGYAIIDVLATIPTIDLDLDLENIDFDAVWLSDKNFINNFDKSLPNPISDSDIFLDDNNAPNQNTTINLAKDFRNFDITSEIKVKRIKYLEEEIKNLNLYITISKLGQVLILPLTLELPDSGLVRMNGVIENSLQPKFVGKVYINGQNLNEVFKWLKIESQNLKYDNLKEYALYSDIMITPHFTNLNDLYFNINNGQTELLGEAKIDYSSKTSNILSSFEISKFNFNDYFLTSNQNIYLSVGQLLKKLLWLNSISANNDLTLHFDNLTYNNLNFVDQNLKMRFGQGYFEVTDMKLKSDEFDMSALLSVDISGQEPKLDISLSSDNFKYVSTQNNAEGKINAIDQFFALPSLEGFSGTINFDIKSANIDNLDLKNIDIEGKFKDGIIDFSKFSSDIYSGNMQYTGSIGVKFDKNFSGNLNFNDVALKPLLSDLFGLRTVDGKANITSSITSLANKKEDFKKNLSSEIKVSAAGVSVDSFGLNDLVKKMFNQKNYKNELQNPEKILFNPLATTAFTQATGSVSITKNDGGQFKFDLTALAVSGILSGKIDITKNSIDGLANIIFLSGNRNKQTPINIASGLKGSLDNIMQSTNMDQVRQYLGLSGGSTYQSDAAPVKNDVATPEEIPTAPVTVDVATQKQVDATQNNIDNMSKAVIDAAEKAKLQAIQSTQPQNAQ